MILFHLSNMMVCIRIIPVSMTHMPFLHQHPDGLRRDERFLPDVEFRPDLPQQIQNRVAVLPVLQLYPMVLSSHSDTGEPGKHHKEHNLRGQTPRGHDVVSSFHTFCSLKNIKDGSSWTAVSILLMSDVNSPSLQLVHLFRGNHHVPILIHVLEGLEGLHLLGHLLQAHLQDWTESPSINMTGQSSSLEIRGWVLRVCLMCV